MEKEKLHRFFAGTTSIQEGMDIRAWMEASEENKRIFYKERKLFDALMVHDDQTTNNCISTKRIPKIIRQWLKMYLANLHTSFLCNLIYPTFSRILLYSC